MPSKYSAHVYKPADEDSKNKTENIYTHTHKYMNTFKFGVLPSAFVYEVIRSWSYRWL